MGRMRAAPLIAILTAASLAAIAASLAFGSSGIDAPWERLAAGDPLMRTIVWELRLPRALAAFGAGIVLALAGVLMQALLRNPLADPYVLGVSSGSALGVSVAVLLGIGSMSWAIPVLPICGFIGGLLALLILYRMSAASDRLPVHSILLAGVILNAIFSALIMFITSIMEPNRSFSTITWLMGTLAAPADKTLLGVAIYLASRAGAYLTGAVIPVDGGIATTAAS